MNTDEKEAIAAEKVIHSAYHHVMSYAKNEDIEAATIALLWAAFQKQAKEFGLTEWRGLALN